MPGNIKAGDGNVLAQRDGALLILTLNRPAKRNALTSAALIALRKQLDAAAADAALRVVILAGAGEHAFCAGMDVSEFENRTPQEAHALINQLKDVGDRMRGMPQVVIVALHGVCVGAALELAMAADLRVAAEGTRFAMPEVNLGIPSVLDSIALQQYVGLSLAKEMLLLGNMVSLARINHSGFINRVVPVGQALAAARTCAAEVVQRPGVTLAQQKTLFETWQNVGFDAANADSTNAFALAFATDVPARQLAAYQRERAVRRGRKV